jgi:hypothetical protein
MIQRDYTSGTSCEAEVSFIGVQPRLSDIALGKVYFSVFASLRLKDK